MPRRTVAFQRGADFAMQLRACERGDPLVKHLPVDRVAECIPELGSTAVRRRFPQPPQPVRQLGARRGHGRRIALEHFGEGACSELHAADARRVEQHALLGPKPPDILLDDAGQVLRDLR